MKTRLPALCACLVLGLVVAGCGDDDEESNGGAATTERTTTTETAAGGGASAQRRQVAVDVVDNDYDPREVTVPRGATVTWTNTGDVPHTVTKDGGPGPDFDSGTMAPGDTFKQKLDAAGTIDYLCEIHAGQRGSVTVQ